MAARNLGDMIVRIVGENAEFDKAIDKSQRKFENFGKAAEKIGRQLTTFVTLPIVGIGTAAVKAASDAEETRSKFATVFRDMGDEAELAADALAESYGLAGTQARRLLGDTGDLLTGFGFAQEEAFGLSEQVNALAVDLASFTNFSGGAEGASAALTKALLGERESIKSLGIAITEADIKQLAEDRGIVGELTRQQKAVLTLDLAIRQSQNAIGDFERTQDSLANQLRQLRADTVDVAESFGRVLLPAAQNIIGTLRDFAGRLAELDEGQKRTIVQVAAFAAAIGPASLIVGNAIKLIDTLARLKASLVAFYATAGGPVTLAIAGITALGIALAKLASDAGKRQLEEQGDAVGAIGTAAELSTTQVNAMNQALTRGLIGNVGQAVQEVNRLSASMDVSKEAIIDVLIQSERVSDEYKAQLDQLRTSVQAQREIATEVEQEATLRAAAAESARDTTEAVRETREIQTATADDIRRAELAAQGLKAAQIETVLARDAAQKTYNEELLITQRRLQGGVITEREAIERNIEAINRFRTALSDLSYAPTAESAKEAGVIGTQMFLDLNVELERYKERLKDFEPPIQAASNEHRELYEDVVEYARASESQVDEINRFFSDRRKQRIEEEKEAERQQWLDRFSIASQVTGQLSALASALSTKRRQEIDNEQTREMQRIEAWTEAERQRIESSIADETARDAALRELETQRTDLVNELNADTAKEQRKLAREEARRSKTLALFDIAINTAKAIVQALTRPWLVGFVAAAGAAQAALVASTPLPDLARGGIVDAQPGGVPIRVAEAGQPEVIFPLDRLESFLSERSMGPMGGNIDSTPIQLTVMMDSRPILDKIFEGTRNRRILIDARSVV